MILLLFVFIPCIAINSDFEIYLKSYLVMFPVKDNITTLLKCATELTEIEWTRVTNYITTFNFDYLIEFDKSFQLFSGLSDL